ncbi:hypothetical protein Moror_11537 [Moniliophthora roreri MCA 2997]|uniref:DUF6534 domain-containing protein n=1 Tax=Moniliophthora roreri (strain MCA 2997) TaxID=1381753 RepID=V2WTV9_MONRO|nr:hypothetical protein Moror_11537 [Moniliophthora roreri MCA 2997]
MGDFDMVVGTYLLGIFVNTFLFGLVCYQFLVYKNTKFNDPTWIKSVVAALFFIDVIHSIVEVYGAWEMCVTNYANPPSLFFVSWVIPFTAATTAVAALITQAFLCHRVRGLTKNNILTGLIGLLSVVGCVFGITAGIKSGIIREVAKFGPLAPFVIRKLYFDVFDPLQNTEAFPEVWLSFQTAADVLITAALTVVLYRSRTGFRRTDSIINRLIRGAIQTGFFVTVFALGDLFSFLFIRDTNWYAFFAFPIGRIYTNTMLDTLNSRQSLKQVASGTLDMDTESNAIEFRMNTRGTMTKNTITVTKDIVTDQRELEEASKNKDKKSP